MSEGTETITPSECGWKFEGTPWFVEGFGAVTFSKRIGDYTILKDGAVVGIRAKDGTVVHKSHANLTVESLAAVLSNFDREKAALVKTVERQRLEIGGLRQQHDNLLHTIDDQGRKIDALTGPVVPDEGEDEAEDDDAAGIEVNASGGKQSKLTRNCGLLPPAALLSVAEVLTRGAKKYGADNWRLITVWEHISHALTHLCLQRAGDTSEEHLAHAACCILMALEVDLEDWGGPPF